MTVLFVLATLIVFLTADYFVQRSRARKATQVVTEQVTTLAGMFKQIPDGTEVFANHMWAKPAAGGVVTIGLDEFIGKFLGAVEQIALPRVGAGVEPRLASVRLHDKGKAVAMALPVEGKVVAINHELLSNPSAVAADPYGRGWLVRVQTAGGDGYDPGYAGTQAMQWLRAQADAARDFFAGVEGQGGYVLMQDGGEPVGGLLKHYDGDVWKEFQDSFMSLQEDAEGMSSVRSNQ